MCKEALQNLQDGILSGVKTKDTGEVGENLSLLLTTMQGIDMDKLQEKERY